jgi:hypothetical protein
MYMLQLKGVGGATGIMKDILILAVTLIILYRWGAIPIISSYSKNIHF